MKKKIHETKKKKNTNNFVKKNTKNTEGKGGTRLAAKEEMREGRAMAVSSRRA